MSKGAARPRRPPAAAAHVVQANGPAFVPAAPAAQVIGLASDATCRDALRALVASVRGQIEPARALILASDAPEGPHQLRVGLRRLRCGLRTFEPLLDIAAANRLDDAARSVGLKVGRLRDADVLVNEICRSALENSGQDAAALAPVLANDHRQARAATRAALSGTDWTTLLRRLAVFERAIMTLPTLDQPAKPQARIALKQLWKKAARRGKRIDELDDEERHDLRIAIKRLRYGVDLLGSLYDRKRVRSYRGQLRTLQDGLGYLNDVANARRLIDLVDSASTGARGQTVAIAVLDWHATRAAAQWPATRKQWARLAKARRFWR